MSEKKAIFELDSKNPINATLKRFTCYKVTEAIKKSFLSKKRLFESKALNRPNLNINLYKPFLEIERGTNETYQKLKKQHSKALKHNADFSENINSTSTYEESNAISAFELQAENDCFAFLIETSNKQKYEKNNEKNVFSKKNFSLNINKEKEINLNNCIEKNFNYNTSEKILQNINKDKVIFESEKNSETDSKFELIHAFNIYLPEEGECLENVSYEKNKEEFKYQSFFSKNSEFNNLKTAETSIDIKDNFEIKVCNDNEDSFDSNNNNNILDNNNNIDYKGPEEPLLLDTIEGNKNQNVEKSNKFEKPYKTKKVRKNGVDELMQDSFLKCFFTPESKKAPVKVAKNEKTKNKIHKDYHIINDNKKNINEKKERVEDYSIKEFNHELSAESTKIEIFDNNSKSGEINEETEKKEFLLCSSYELLNQCLTLNDSNIIDNKKDDENLHENSLNSNIFKKENFHSKLNYKKKVTGPIAKLIKEHKSHNFMFKYFPREYRKDIFNIRFQKQQNRRKFLKNKIFVCPKDLQLHKFDYLKIENKTNFNQFYENNSNLDLNECSKPKKVWEPKNIKENLISDYLFNIERKWPLDVYHFAQDAALDYLMLMKFNSAKTIKYIQFTNRHFKSFMKNRGLKIKRSEKGKEELNI